MLVKDIKIPIFLTTVKVYIDSDLGELKQQLRQIEAPFSNTTWDALTTFNEVTGTVGIYITTQDFLGDLHHECIHAANYILFNKGISVSTEEDEALAYLSTFIFKEGLTVKEEFDKMLELKKLKKPMAKNPIAKKPMLKTPRVNISNRNSKIKDA